MTRNKKKTEWQYNISESNFLKSKIKKIFFNLSKEKRHPKYRGAKNKADNKHLVGKKYDFTYMWNIKTKQTIWTKQTCGCREQSGGYQRKRGGGEGKIGKEINCTVMNVNPNSSGEHAAVYAKAEIYYCIHQTYNAINQWYVYKS